MWADWLLGCSIIRQRPTYSPSSLRTCSNEVSSTIRVYFVARRILIRSWGIAASVMNNRLWKRRTVCSGTVGRLYFFFFFREVSSFGEFHSFSGLVLIFPVLLDNHLSRICNFGNFDSVVPWKGSRASTKSTWNEYLHWIDWIQTLNRWMCWFQVTIVGWACMYF